MLKSFLFKIFSIALEPAPISASQETNDEEEKAKIVSQINELEREYTEEEVGELNYQMMS